jgi:hypothetical protein
VPNLCRKNASAQTVRRDGCRTTGACVSGHNNDKRDLQGGTTALADSGQSVGMDKRASMLLSEQVTDSVNCPTTDLVAFSFELV